MCRTVGRPFTAYVQVQKINRPDNYLLNTKERWDYVRMKAAKRNEVVITA